MSPYKELNKKMSALKENLEVIVSNSIDLYTWYFVTPTLTEAFKPTKFVGSPIAGESMIEGYFVNLEGRGFAYGETSIKLIDLNPDYLIPTTQEKVTEQLHKKIKSCKMEILAD